jgi:hypothetical protein
VPDRFAALLQDEVDAGSMTQDEMDDMLAQRDLYDTNRSVIEQDPLNDGRYVGFVAGNMISATSTQGLVDQFETQLPGRLCYFETVGFDF